MQNLSCNRCNAVLVSIRFPSCPSRMCQHAYRHAAFGLCPARTGVLARGGHRAADPHAVAAGGDGAPLPVQVARERRSREDPVRLPIRRRRAQRVLRHPRARRARRAGERARMHAHARACEAVCASCTHARTSRDSRARLRAHAQVHARTNACATPARIYDRACTSALRQRAWDEIHVQAYHLSASANFE
eukprot:3479999-Pleurochrysis_carterae.AAC.1